MRIHNTAKNGSACREFFLLPLTAGSSTAGIWKQAVVTRWVSCGAVETTDFNAGFRINDNVAILKNVISWICAKPRTTHRLIKSTI
ncbi:MAG: hypothetical protein DMG12_12380 [Acidobacteria bacterium]|nr:MAG: hypothetical protein DMG12_12380 [Acidobacteriota bacterium]